MKKIGIIIGKSIWDKEVDRSFGCSKGCAATLSDFNKVLSILM